MNITVLGLTNPDVNLKRMHQLYIVRLLYGLVGVLHYISRVGKVFVRLSISTVFCEPLLVAFSFCDITKLSSVGSLIFLAGLKLGNVNMKKYLTVRV